MIRLAYTVRFNSPAFLGDAEQNGRWRTPPFKALLRQWWRVASGITDVARLREEEGRLFGLANDDGGGSQKSRVRLRLESWGAGHLQSSQWPGSDERKVTHPEVTNREGKSIPVGAELYLGYGPLNYYKDKKATGLKANAAIQANETKTLRLSCPSAQTSLDDALQLMHWFGTVGGRSRNGWGSLDFLPLPPGEGRGEAEALSLLMANKDLLHRVSRPLHECLERDWPHALGQDAAGRLLIWQSEHSFANWREAMQALARAKIGFRTQFPLGDAGPFQKRHLLAYPVTHHPVAAWGNQQRLANQLRFKVARTTDNRLAARIFHLPCSLPEELAHKLGRTAPSLQQQADVWRQVHAWLDDTPVSGFKRT